jgi:hypothetical protein
MKSNPGKLPAYCYNLLTLAQIHETQLVSLIKGEGTGYENCLRRPDLGSMPGQKVRLLAGNRRIEMSAPQLSGASKKKRRASVTSSRCLDGAAADGRTMAMSAAPRHCSEVRGHLQRSPMCIEP